MEYTNCIFCSNHGNKIVIEGNGYSGRKCNKCRLIYILPRPNLVEIKNLYGHDKAHISIDTYLNLKYRIYKKLYAKRTLRIIKRYIKNNLMFEVRCGANFFLT